MVAQTIEAAKASGNLEELCRAYASMLDELMQVRTPGGDAEVAGEVARLRRDMATVNARLAVANDEIEVLRGSKR